MSWWLGFAVALCVLSAALLMSGLPAQRAAVFALFALAACCLGLAGWLARPRTWEEVIRARSFGDATMAVTDPSTSPSDHASDEGEVLDVIARLGQPVALVAIRVPGASMADEGRPLSRIARVALTWVPSAPQYQIASDTMAVLVPSAQVNLVAPLVLNRSRKALRDDRPVYIAVAFHPDDGRDLASLAHAAIGVIGRDGEPIMVVDADTAARANLRGRMTSELRAAIRDREIVAHFQPVVDARTGQVVGAEALARWLRGDAGVVEASEFVAATEGSGAALDLGARMVRHACRLGAVWRTHVAHGAFVAVNLSDTELRDRRTVEVVAEELAAWDLPAAALRADVPYATFRRGRSPALAAILRLMDLGMQVWVETATTSLPDLEVIARLGMPGVKVPVGALLDMGDAIHEHAYAWLEELGMRGLQLHVTRVESSTQLRRLGMIQAVGYLQGWAVAAPVPPGDVPAMLGLEPMVAGPPPAPV